MYRLQGGFSGLVWHGNNVFNILCFFLYFFRVPGMGNNYAVKVRCAPGSRKR